MKAVAKDWHDEVQHRQHIAEALEELADGKLNSTSNVTLTANSTTTVIVDFRVGANSVILLSPITANAATEFASGGMYVSSTGKQTYTITHNNNAQTDRDFRVLVVG